MGRAAITQRRRNKRGPFLGYPDRWVATGTDQYGEPFVDEQWSREQAEAVAARLNRKGGKVEVIRQRWSSPKADFYTVPDEG